MKAYLKELKFPSTQTTYLEDITEKVAEAVLKSGVKQGFLIVNAKHTTMGVVVMEIAEPNLLEDIVRHTLSQVHEDKRSTRVDKDYPHPTTDYLHRCQDNPFCNEIDEDYNAAAHLRCMMYSHPAVSVPIQEGKLELGKYQQIAVFEFDGRDGQGKNPIRQRTIQIWIYTADELQLLD